VKKSFSASELIRSKAGAVYHLDLLPEQLSRKIILVGDPDRVPLVSQYFDQLYYRVQHREFVTHTGRLGKHAISVISSGIGTDNIDIVLNEIDALLNINQIDNTVNDSLVSCEIVRLGTSGALQPDIAVDSLVASTYGLGIDGLMPFYEQKEDKQTAALLTAILDHQPGLKSVCIPYLSQADAGLLAKIGHDMPQGITLTSPGFYGPQGRELRYRARYAQLLTDAQSFSAGKLRMTNFEMETAGIYGLAQMLGHRALSVNAIIANRALGQFSRQAAATIDRMIQLVLARFTSD
jgi:uridine phosphorylase